MTGDFVTEPDRPVAALPGPPATPPPAPVPSPPRRGRAALIAAGAVGLVVLVAAGVAAVLLLNPGPANVAALSPTTDPPTTAPSPTPRPTPTDYTGPLSALALPKPAGAVYAPDQRIGAADGSLSKQQLTELWNTANGKAFALQRLTELSYQRGYIVAWLDGASLVYVRLTQFRTSQAAEGWTDLEQGGFSGPIMVSTDKMAGVEHGYIYVTNQKDGHGAHARFSWGVIAVSLDVFNPDKADADAMRTMAADQLALLP
jgi:hypothetical protein